MRAAHLYSIFFGVPPPGKSPPIAATLVESAIKYSFCLEMHTSEAKGSLALSPRLHAKPRL